MARRVSAWWKLISSTEDAAFGWSDSIGGEDLATDPKNKRARVKRALFVFTPTRLQDRRYENKSVAVRLRKSSM